jgi:D-3-phosphoglycerate dehydrogenase
MKIVFIDTTHPILVNLFKEKGWEVVLKNGTDKNELAKELHLYDGIVIRSRFKLDKEFLKHGTNLQFIGRPGAGLENIDTDYCKTKNIHVFRSPEGNRDAVAEHGIGMLLTLFNKINEANSQIKNGIWDRIANRGEEIMGNTIGIIGYGYMGEAFAKRLQGFGANVIAYDKYKELFNSNTAKEVSLDTIFNETDILSIHTPLTTETIGMYDYEFISKFKKDSYILNTARGQSLILNDLVKHLKTGKVKGACLDVLEIEKTGFENIFNEKNNDDLQFLIESKNVILTPHVAGWTHQSNKKMAQFLGEKIIKHFS